MGCVASIPEENGSIEAFFCDKVNCTQVFAEKTLNSNSVDCAIYNTGKTFSELLKKKNARLVTDGDYPVSWAKKEKGSGYMHNKFCIIDNQYVWTGSWNPNQEDKTANNVVVIQSKTLAKAYRSEFKELFEGKYRKGDPEPGKVKFNGQLLEAYFCPEDNCTQHVLEILNSAKKSIHFMTFAFTDDAIGNLLIEKSQNVDILGIFDEQKDDKYSEYPKLKKFSRIKDVHHKVFIIDESTVITGSYNPSKNANEDNDENIVIIRDAQIAQQFEKEFADLFN